VAAAAAVIASRMPDTLLWESYRTAAPERPNQPVTAARTTGD
jgi:hypothetical protein